MIRSLFLSLSLILTITASGQSEIYELRVYEMQFRKSANLLHNYFENALIPALNRQGIDHVGAFEEIGNTMPKKIYLLLSYESMQDYQEVNMNLKKDQQFAEDSESYTNTSPDDIPFKRIKSTLIGSATGFPRLLKPSGDSELFELRIYESYHEDALRRKVKMFNDSEFDIFEETGLNMVFFGPNISGDQMPCLTYLLAFKDMNDRDEAWSKFRPHPEWKRIVELEEYANTVSSISRVFLKPLSYSQL